MLKQQLDQDLKAALLSGNSVLATTLRGLKSVILYAEVEKGVRDTGLDDESIIALFVKEAKKRQESADLYQKGGNADRAAAELTEKKVIEGYLPQQMTDDDLRQLVDNEASKLGAATMQDMGKLIAAVKQAAGASADGARIAQLVKERLS